jgi:hypothetical protein
LWPRALVAVSKKTLENVKKMDQKFKNYGKIFIKMPEKGDSKQMAPWQNLKKT